jgi:hypothetical protein
MYFQFYLDDLEIDEPQGFDDIVLNMKRDDNWHGIFFEASTSDLAFYGVAAAYLKDKKQTQGLKSDVTFKALQACGVYDEPETILEGKLDFGKYSESCGNTCRVKIPVEQIGCLMTLRNRYDQKVDLDALTTFNKMSALQQYDKLNFEMELPAKELQAVVDGSVATDGCTLECGYGYANTTTVWLRPNYHLERYNSIATGQLQAINNIETNGGLASSTCTDGPITPQLLFEDIIACFDGNYAWHSRMKGTLSTSDFEGHDTGSLLYIKHAIVKWDGTTGSIFDNGELVVESMIADYTGAPQFPPFSVDFDNDLSGTVTLADGYSFYAVLEIGLGGVSSPIREVTVTTLWEPETIFTIDAVKICPPTNANVYAINETLSRVTEAITDNCLKVKSDYYGRTDSQPYASAEDGCGALRVTTSGLKIRRAPTPAFFASLKDLFDGLRGIDNVGMGIEPNPFIAGFDWLRIEPVEYFYQDIEILRLPFVPEAEILIQEQLHYSKIKSGYQKWEVERINGLDEPNSNREYRTGLTSVNNEIDTTSKFVAGSYAIEVTRQQTFAKTGAADTTYDNETFIICVERQAYSFVVEQGNIDNAANVFSPQTLYNWRIRPFSNLMRWFKSIANSYANISDTSHKLFFSSGTGNYLAEGQMAGAYPTCKLENGVKAENRDLGTMDFVDTTQAKPLWKPEYATLKYPLSVADYRTIKSGPYGFVSFQCGTGEWKKGYIQNLRYRLNRGDADFTLKIKWE